MGARLVSMKNHVEEEAQTTKLAARACQVGGAVCAASIACAQAQLPNWTWIFVVTAAFGAAAFCSGGLFLILDGLHTISKSSERKEIIKRGYLLSFVGVPLVALALATFFWFPPAARLFNQSEQQASVETAPPSPPASPPNQSAASNPPPSPPAVSVQPAIPAQPPIAAQPAPLPAPTAGASAAPVTTPPTPPPRVQEAPIVEEIEFVSLYGNTPRTLCGQPRLSARPSSVARPSPTGWILYSTDYLSGFQERPLAYGEPIRFGNCTLILERIEPELPRFDFKVIHRE